MPQSEQLVSSLCIDFVSALDYKRTKVEFDLRKKQEDEIPFTRLFGIEKYI